MPVHARLIDAGHGILSTGEGEIVVGDVARSIDALALELGRTKFAAVRYILSDFRAITTYQGTSDAMHAIVQQYRAGGPFSSPIRQAIVAPRDVVYGVARMYEAYQSSPGWIVEVCRSLPAALTWLGITEQTLET
jgi:hypothetical protein